MGNEIARVQVISAGVGEILDSDVMMAKAANATIVGFSVTASRSVQNSATQNGVPVCTSDIIYRLVDDVRERVTALLPVVVETKVTGEATILQLFDIDLKQKQTMKIAGCRVTNGILEKQNFVRVLRNGNVLFDGTLSTMRHIKKDITEARKGTECGLGFGEFRDLEAGDLIQMYEKIEKPGVL
jgi:translation initiation factor IF-2